MTGPRPSATEPADRWTTWEAMLWRTPVSADALGQRLAELADELRPLLIRSTFLDEEWAPLGLRVSTVRMRDRGNSAPGLGSRLILINRDDPWEVQRYTMAHEVAHLLLAGKRTAGVHLQYQEEEDLCEQFASALLVPREYVAGRLDALCSPPPPDDILRLCGELNVNVRPVMYAVGQLLADQLIHLLYARWSTHPLRPDDERAFRVQASSGDRRVLFPRFQRLNTIGLRSAADAGSEAQHGAVFGGVSPDVHIELRRLPGEKSSAALTGEVRWTACRQGNDSPYLLMVLDIADVVGDLLSRADLEER